MKNAKKKVVSSYYRKPQNWCKIAKNGPCIYVIAYTSLNRHTFMRNHCRVCGESPRVTRPPRITTPLLFWVFATSEQATKAIKCLTRLPRTGMKYLIQKWKGAASVGSCRMLRDISQWPQYPWVLVHLVRVSRPVAIVLLAVPSVIQVAAPPLKIRAHI